MAEAAPAKKAEAAPELLVLVLSAGMPGSDLAGCLESLKQSSKSISSHKRRELYWDAYGKLITKASGIDGPAHCFLLYRAASDGDGAVEVVELTKRQRGLVGAVDLLGLKLKPLQPDGKPDPSAKTWCMAWSEDEAQTAWEDLMSAEPCIYVTADGVYVATRYKRVLCKALSGPMKALKDVEQLVGELAPEKPLRSISFSGNAPPSVSGYNTFLAGPMKLDKPLPATIGHINSTSTSELYDYFLQRQNGHLIAEAEKLIAQMLADVGRSLTPIVYSSSQKDCSTAYKNALMKRVFVHESMKKFVERVRADGQVELNVIKGDVGESQFGKYGSLVFELFYRCDLSTML